MGKFNEKLDENRQQDYLPEDKHEVIIKSAEIKYGDDASPAWATKSIKFMFSNDEGVAFWDCELAPLKLQNGDDNDMAVTIAMGNLEKMGLEWDEVDSIEDFAEQAEAFVMSGAPLGAKVQINITGKDSDKINEHTGKPYRNRNLYVNKLLEGGAGGDGVAAASGAEAEVATF